MMWSNSLSKLSLTAAVALNMGNIANSIRVNILVNIRGSFLVCREQVDMFCLDS